jgi:hypothetical protein
LYPNGFVIYFEVSKPLSLIKIRKSLKKTPMNQQLPSPLWQILLKVGALAGFMLGVMYMFIYVLIAVLKVFVN